MNNESRKQIIDSLKKYNENLIQYGTKKNIFEDVVLEILSTILLYIVEVEKDGNETLNRVKDLEENINHSKGLKKP